MSYMWENFNIKQIRAETIVYRDGVFCPELSTIESGKIEKHYDLPVHIIYVGEIAGKNRLNIDLNTENQTVLVSVIVKNNLPAFLNIFAKNTGKNSKILGHILLENNNSLTYECNAGHFSKNTDILFQHKLIAGRGSISKMSAVATIAPNCENCNSDIAFSAIAASDAKIEFTPAQRISSIPNSAGHSASLYTPKPIQIQYLRESGLGTHEIDDVIHEAFMNDFSLF